MITLRSKVRILFHGLLLMGLHGWAGSVQGQEAGSIVGRVSNQEGTPLGGIEVRLEGSNISVVTGRTGVFVFTGIKKDEPVLIVEGLGYRSARLPVKGTAEALKDIRLEPDPILLDGLLVEGRRMGQAMAMQQQRSADNLQSIVSSERIGRFPDPNAAEALQRLPGIAISRDQGEGRYVLIRGTDPRLSAVSINGARVPVPEGEGRRVALDVIPADILGGIEVHKTLTPDMDGDAIGGAVNLVTRGAAWQRDVMKLTLAGGFNALTTRDISQVAGNLSRRFGKERRLGFVMAGSYYATHRGTDNIEMEWDKAFDSDVLNDLQFRDYSVSRDRLGFMGMLEYSFPDDRSSFQVTGVFNDYSDQEFRRRSRIRFGKGDYLSSTAVTGARMERELKNRFEKQRIWSATASGIQAVGRGTLEYRASYSHAEEAEPGRSDMTMLQEEMGFEFDVSDPWRPNYSVTQGDEFAIEGFEFDELVLEDAFTGEDALVGAIDFSWPFRIGSEASLLKVGGKVRSHDKNRATDIRVFDGFEGDLGLAEVAGPFDDPDFFFRRYRVGHVPGPVRTQQFTQQNLLLFELDEGSSRADTDPANYRADEMITAGYAMMQLNLGNLRLIPGIRFEVTNLTYHGQEVLFDEDGDYISTAPTSARNDQHHILPGLTFRYRMDGLTNLRGAVTRSLARPDYFDLVPYRLINREDEEVELGNEHLKAATSTNFDLAFERFDRSVGILAAGLFYKDLDGYVYHRRYDVGVGDLEGFEAVQPANGGAGRLWGVEFAWSRQLVSLPGALDGLNLQANYTFTDSDMDLEDGTRSHALPGQAKHVGNFALGYDKHGWSARIAVNHRSDYLDEVGDSREEDIHFASHTQLDLSGSYQVTSNAQLFFEAINITNQPLSLYMKGGAHPIQQEYYSWWGHLGVKLNIW